LTSALFAGAGRSNLEHEDTRRTHRLCPGQRSTCPPQLPSPLSSATDIPAALSLPSLTPRAQPSWTYEGREPLSAQTSSLLDFVSQMSLDDAHAASSSRHPAFLEEPLKQEDEPMKDATATATEGARHSYSFNSSSQLPLSTPETSKLTFTTPQATRFCLQQKRQAVLDSTPVAIVEPQDLSLPSLCGVDRHSTYGVHHYSQEEQGPCQEPKSYNGLLRNAPMLPASPDLESDLMRYHGPCFSPVGGVTIANTRFVQRHFAACRDEDTSSMESPSSTEFRARNAPEAAGLPSLDLEEEQTARKWLRMKRRTSLLSALRMQAATQI
jgi:hypothetical protein